MIIEVMEREYWSKADAFLIPLTGLVQEENFKLKSYLFWNEFSIEDYKLILSFTHEDKEKFEAYCKKYLFPKLSKKVFLTESFDLPGKTIFIIDISEWALDVEMLLVGKYSKFSAEMKDLIEKHHSFRTPTGLKIPIAIFAAIYPNKKMKLLDDKTPIEWSAERYNLPLTELREVGEVGGMYDRIKETLYRSVAETCQDGSRSDMEQ